MIKQLQTRRVRRAMAGLLGAVACAAAFATQPALAQGGGGKSDSATETAAANAALHAAAKGAVEALVSSHTISQHQADVINRGIYAGSVDYGALVANGVVSQAQMNAVAKALADVKRAFGSEGTNATGAGATDRDSAAANAEARAHLHAAAIGAVEGLVSEHTISQHQADVIDREIEAGSVDSAALVASGTVSQPQMKAVDNALAAVKRAFAA